MLILLSRLVKSVCVLAALSVFVACAAPAAPTADRPLLVVSTSLVADVVHAIAGDTVQMRVLLPPGADPHSVEITPQDMAALTQADIVFINGLGLEETLEPVLADIEARVVPVSDDIVPLSLDETHEDEADAHEHENGDPHVWTDPNNVAIWAAKIAEALSAQYPENADTYAANAAAYQKQLGEPDTWIEAQVAQIPVENRKLVLDHAVFGYFARRYGFEQIGAVMPGFSTMAEPSAQELAALEDAIRDLGVKAIFVGNTINSTVAQRVASDTGVKLARLYTDSLSKADGPAATYLDYMRANTETIVEALK